jgi:membrane carboxypeptidase/penicillin-binding protein
MKKILLNSALITILVAASYYFYATLPDVSVLNRTNPRATALIKLRDQEYRKIGLRGARQQIWVPYNAVSEHLKRAILIGEDAAFFSHQGIDLRELKAALKKVWETLSFSRGGSTITMQLARNLYLSPAKNPLRKLKEIVIARQLEQSCPSGAFSRSISMSWSWDRTSTVSQPRPGSISANPRPKSTLSKRQPSPLCFQARAASKSESFSSAEI